MFQNSWSWCRMQRRSYNILLWRSRDNALWNTCGAVSYTHLDVYKRQVCVCVRTCWAYVISLFTLQSVTVTVLWQQWIPYHNNQGTSSEINILVIIKLYSYCIIIYIYHKQWTGFTNSFTQSHMNSFSRIM